MDTARQAVHRRRDLRDAAVRRLVPGPAGHRHALQDALPGRGRRRHALPAHHRQRPARRGAVHAQPGDRRARGSSSCTCWRCAPTGCRTWWRSTPCRRAVRDVRPARRVADAPSPLGGITGSVMLDGWAASCRIVCVATHGGRALAERLAGVRVRRELRVVAAGDLHPDAVAGPVLVTGRPDLDPVGVGWLGGAGVGFDSESRKDVRRMPSFRLTTSPSGLTTASLAVKSVSGADDAPRGRPSSIRSPRCRAATGRWCRRGRRNAARRGSGRMAPAGRTARRSRNARRGSARGSAGRRCRRRAASRGRGGVAQLALAVGDAAGPGQVVGRRMCLRQWPTRCGLPHVGAHQEVVDPRRARRRRCPAPSGSGRTSRASAR